VNPDGVQFRMTALGVVVVCLFGALFARLWYLQVIDTSQFKLAAQSNGVQLVSTPAPRGRILDRNGKVLVDNELVDVLTMDRAIVAKNPEDIDEVAALLGESREALILALDDERYTSLAPVPVAQPDAAQITYVKEHAAELPGVDIAQQVQRVYPNGSLAAHILGYVGQINAQELATHKGYGVDDQIGKSGIELAYEGYLRGTPGVTKLEVDSNGDIIGTAASEPPIQGDDIRLTIDQNIQNIAENSLYEGLQVARDTIDRDKGSQFAGRFYPAPGGAVVVEDPQNGEILALASQPTYNPSEFVGGLSEANYQALTAPSSGQPLEDRATSGLYAPGSTFKLVTATAGLDAGLITATSPFYDKGYIKVGPQRFNNDSDAAYGTIDLPTAITVSDDSYFYTLGADFWEDNRSLQLQATAHAYGFGSPTGIPIGGEAPGLVPDPTTRRLEYEEYPGDYETPNWYTGDNVNLAIGQGELTVTPLQLANAYSAFANGGTLYQPQLALDAQDQKGVVKATFVPKVIRQIPLPAADRTAMLEGFEGVVSSGDGTAYGAFKGWPYAQFPVAGKTGTAQVYNKEPTSVFVAWEPAVNPQYLVVVFEEQAGYGASAAAPLARRILAGITGQPMPPPVYIADAAVN
jgi:penicillin-binding protein 2